jgi:23S rRNA pseudouridine2605 synthase
MKNTRKPGEGGRKPFKGDGEGRKPFRADGDGPARGARPGGKPPAKKSFGSKPKTAAPKNPDHLAVTGEGERISKIMARAGVASRRDCERMILEGRVSLNGRVLESPAVNCTPSDVIEVDGKQIGTIERTRLWIYYKPAGLVTTNFDPEGRPTVFDNLPEELPRVISVGRLDINTEGLLLLTNDGGLARMLELPTTGWLRRYRVRAYGEIDQAKLDELKEGIAVEGVFYGAIEATLDRQQGHNVWITMGLREGKNREIKNVLGALGLDVNRLIRISYGPFQLGELEDGQVVEIKSRTLRDQLGPRLIADANANFEAPIHEPSQKEEKEPAETWERGVRAERPKRESREDRRDRDLSSIATKRPDRGERTDRPARTERPDRGDRPDRGERPARARDGDDARGAPRGRDRDALRGGDRDRDFDRKGPPRDGDKKKRPPLGTTRTANVWMAPGARPVAVKKSEAEAADAGATGTKRKVLRLRKDAGNEAAPARARAARPSRSDRPERSDRAERSERPERRERPASKPFAGKRDDTRTDGDRVRPARSTEGKRADSKPRGERTFGEKREGAAKAPRSFAGKPAGDGPRKDGPRGGDGPRKGPAGGRGKKSVADRRR